MIWDNYECEGQMDIYDYIKEDKPNLQTIDNNLKSCAPQYDVYTYSFTLEEVKHINRALQRYDLVKEIRQLIEEQNK